MNYICIYIPETGMTEEYFVGIFEVPKGATPNEIMKEQVKDFEPSQYHEYAEHSIDKLPEPKFFYIDQVIVTKAKQTPCSAAKYGVCSHARNEELLELYKKFEVEKEEGESKSYVKCKKEKI